MNKTITLNSEWQFAAISDDAVLNILADLNDDRQGEPYIYSETQVKAAMWGFLEDEIERLQENIEECFMAALNKMSTYKERALLGDPEVSVKEEQKLAHADYLHDLARDA